MKILNYILAFYIILLATVPCCVFDNCPDDKAEQTAKHERGDNDCGNCSPFFSCEGCATAIVVYHPPCFEINAALEPAVYAAYVQTDLPSAQYDIWQPPQLG